LKTSSKLDSKIANSPKSIPSTRLGLKVSVPAKTERMPVTAAENGIITATILASMCFMAFVRIVQHNAELIRAKRITNSICEGLKEKTIGSIILAPACVGIEMKLNNIEKSKETKKLVTACTARYNAVLSFFAYIPVKAILKPYNNPATPHSISPTPKAVPENDAPFNTKVLNKQTTHPRIVVSFGFFLTSMNIITGTVMQERFSKKAYFAGVVYNKPIFWQMFASVMKIPVGIPILR